MHFAQMQAKVEAGRGPIIALFAGVPLARVHFELVRFNPLPVGELFGTVGTGHGFLALLAASHKVAPEAPFPLLATYLEKGSNRLSTSQRDEIWRALMIGGGFVL